MKTIHVFRILSFLIMITMTLVVVIPVFAEDTPNHYAYNIDAEFVWEGTAPDNPCGFDIYIHRSGNEIVNYWTDESGRLTRVIIIWGDVKQTMVSAYGKTVNNLVQGPNMSFYPSDNEVFSLVPGHLMITAPHHGKIWGGAGVNKEYWIYDPSTETWNIAWFKYAPNFIDDFGTFCKYMGP